MHGIVSLLSYFKPITGTNEFEEVSLSWSHNPIQSNLKD